MRRSFSGALWGVLVGTLLCVTMSVVNIFDGQAAVIVLTALDKSACFLGIPELDYPSWPDDYTRWDLACMLAEPMLFALPAVCSLAVYHGFVFRWRRDEHTRCGSCNDILRGLSEPRYPECGSHL